MKLNNSLTGILTSKSSNFSKIKLFNSSKFLIFTDHQISFFVLGKEECLGLIVIPSSVVATFVKGIPKGIFLGFVVKPR